MKVVTQNGDFDLGVTEATPTINMTDFSRKVTDDFGVTTVVERGFSRRMSVKLAVPTANVDAVHRRLSDLRASSALWVADDQAVWLSLYGFYRSFEIDRAGPLTSWCTLEVDALAETANVVDNGADPAPGRASTYRLLQPMTIADATLASSTVAENDAGEWSNGTAYAKGARVIRAATHRVYESLIAGNVGKTPEGQPAWWLDLGPTNRWAMFDQALGTATTRAGGFAVTLNSGASNALAVIDVLGSTVRVQANGYDRTETVRPGAIVFTGLPGGQVTVTIAGGQAAVGTLLVGRMVGLGVTEISPTAGITDYSRKETDDFGAVTVVERAYAKRMSARSLIRTDAIDVVADRLAGVRAQPSLWIAEDGSDCLTIYGLMKEFSIERGTGVSKLSLSVDGLAKAAPAAPASTALVPLGAYDATKTYAAGALVDYQGATWRYINAVPSAGYAPPTLPATRNDFWTVFASVGMTPEQQAEYDKLVAALNALTSDNIIAAGGEKNQIIQLYTQLTDESARAHAASLGLAATYGGDPTHTERAARDAAIGALDTYLTGLTPAWNDATVDTPADGPTLRAKFSDAQAATNQLVQANSAFVRDRAKVALDRAVAIGSDNVLSAGSEKQQTVIDWNTLYQDLESLYAKYVTLGSPSDLTAALNAASAARAALGAYLVGLDPAWNQISTDTPIVSATWSSKWTDAYQRINDFRAQITGRKGDTGAAGASAFKLIAINNVVFPTPDSINKVTGGTNGWDGKAYTEGSSTGGAVISATVLPGTFIGLTTDPTADDSYTSIDYGLHLSTDGGLYGVYRNGPAVWLSSDNGRPSLGLGPQRLIINNDGKTVRYSIQGVGEFFSHPVNTVGERIYGVFALVTRGTLIYDIAFQTGGIVGQPGASAPLLRVQWSIDGVTGWHDNFFGADAYQRQSNDGGLNYGAAFRAVGEGGTVGADGTSPSLVFKRSATVPAAPSDNTGNPPSGWSDGPPTGTDFIWQSKATFRGSTQLTPWSAPQRISGEAGVSPIAVSLQPSTITVQTLANGTPYGGQFPYSIGVTATQAGSAIPVTGISIIATDGITVALNPLRITGVTKTDAYAVIDVSAAGQTQRVQVSATLQRDGANGGTATSIAINAPQLTWTGYTQHGNSIGINASATGKLSVNLTGNMTGDPSADYVLRFVSKLQYRVAGGTWTDVAGSEATSTEGGTTTIGDGGPVRIVRAAVNGTGPYTITGLTVDAAYEVRAMTYRTSNMGSSSVGMSLYAERVQ